MNNTEIYLDVTRTPIKPFGWFEKHLGFKISKGDLSDLLDNSPDEKLKATIRYIYNIRGDLIPFDLVLIWKFMSKRLNHHYDNKIKNTTDVLSEEEVKLLIDSQERIAKLEKKYNPDLIRLKNFEKDE